MGLAPLSPEGGEEGLNHTGKWGGEYGSPGTEKLGSGGQGQQRDDGMQANRAANDTGSKYVALKNVNKDEVTENQESDDWPLGEGNQHANHAGQDGAENGYEFEDERENAKQHSIRNTENGHAAANQDGDDGREQELAANVATHHMFENIDQESDTPALRVWRAAAQPFDDPRAINQEINTGDSRKQNIHERPGYARNEGNDTASNRTRKVRQVAGKLLRKGVDLRLRNTQTPDELYQRWLLPIWAGRQDRAHIVGQQGELLHAGSDNHVNKQAKQTENHNIHNCDGESAWHHFLKKAH